MMPKARVLMHICCGPCAAWPVIALRERDFEVTGFFYNPNIHPLPEYNLRLQAVRQMAGQTGIKMIYKEEHPLLWFRQITYRENNRCFHCCQLRLEKAYYVAKHGRFDYFTSSMLYSKHLKHDMIAGMGHDLAGSGQVKFLYEDFRQGWKKGIELSKDWGLYRQTWCGCLYSNFERFQTPDSMLSRA